MGIFIFFFGGTKVVSNGRGRRRGVGMGEDGHGVGGKMEDNKKKKISKSALAYHRIFAHLYFVCVFFFFFFFFFFFVWWE